MARDDFRMARAVAQCLDPVRAQGWGEAACGCEASADLTPLSLPAWQGADPATAMAAAELLVLFAELHGDLFERLVTSWSTPKRALETAARGLMDGLESGGTSPPC